MLQVEIEKFAMTTVAERRNEERLFVAVGVAVTVVVVDDLVVEWQQYGEECVVVAVVCEVVVVVLHQCLGKEV